MSLRQPTKAKISKASFTISKYFKEVHDSNILNHVGYDFLGGRMRKSIGPRLITPEQYSKRADSENAKYFNGQYEELPTEAGCNRQKILLREAPYSRTGSI